MVEPDNPRKEVISLETAFKAQNVNLQTLETGCYIVGNKIIRCETFHNPPAGLSQAQAGWAYKVDDDPECATSHIRDELERMLQSSQT